MDKKIRIEELDGTRYEIWVVPRGMPAIQIDLTWVLGWLVQFLFFKEQWKIWVYIFRPAGRRLGISTYKHEVVTYKNFRSLDDAERAAESVANAIRSKTWDYVRQ